MLSTGSPCSPTISTRSALPSAGLMRARTRDSPVLPSRTPDQDATLRRVFTTTNLTPDEIHAIGLKEVARIRAEMEQIVREVKFEGSFQEFLDDFGRWFVGMMIGDRSFSIQS